MDIELREVTQANWREALRLTVSPDQQRFIAEYAPVVAVALAKAYLHLDGATWVPYAIYASATMVGFVALAYQSSTADQYWIFHIFIDQRYQGRGYGQAALQRFIELVTQEYPTCRLLQLVVHPENDRAQRLYAAAGFCPKGAERWEEPIYQLAVRSAR
jgi:diamine N-acetyltransferase